MRTLNEETRRGLVWFGVVTLWSGSGRLVGHDPQQADGRRLISTTIISNSNTAQHK